MSHDKIRAAARERMAQTGEPYAAARRAVIREYHQAASKNLAPGTTVPPQSDAQKKAEADKASQQGGSQKS